jgi:small subunit ribosomal protein S3e
MESGAQGAEVSVSGKVRGQRAKSQKFNDGFMIKTGHSFTEYVDIAVRHVMMPQGVLGVKVMIMLPHDPKGIQGPKKLVADIITILEPKDSDL